MFCVCLVLFDFAWFCWFCLVLFVCLFVCWAGWLVSLLFLFLYVFVCLSIFRCLPNGTRAPALALISWLRFVLPRSQKALLPCKLCLIQVEFQDGNALPQTFHLTLQIFSTCNCNSLQSYFPCVTLPMSSGQGFHFSWGFCTPPAPCRSWRAAPGKLSLLQGLDGSVGSAEFVDWFGFEKNRWSSQ